MSKSGKMKFGGSPKVGSSGLSPRMMQGQSVMDDTANESAMEQAMAGGRVPTPSSPGSGLAGIKSNFKQSGSAPSGFGGSQTNFKHKWKGM